MSRRIIFKDYPNKVEFFFSKTINTFFFYFLTRKIGNFNFHSPYSYFFFYSNVGYLSHHLTKTYSDCYQFQRTQKKKLTTPLKYTATPVCQFLGSWTFFSVTFCFKKKNKKKRTTRCTKKELNRTLSLFSY